MKMASPTVCTLLFFTSMHGKRYEDHLGPVYIEWGTPVYWGWFLLSSHSGGHKTKETYPTRRGSPTPCKQGLSVLIVSRGDWLGNPANIKAENNGAVVYVGSSLTVHNPLFFVHKL